MEVTETKKRRFDSRDLDLIAEMVMEEFSKRKKDRGDREKQWEEIDRQLRMEPDIRFKKDSKGRTIDARAWMAEQELPLQAQTLEVLTADARRMMFPVQGPWFRANAALTDDYLDRVDFSSMITGDENEVPSIITQDNANKLIEGWLNSFHRQYDFHAHVDHINAEAFKYGNGIGRVRAVTKNVLFTSAKGTTKRSIKFPALLPRSIKNTYLDDSPHNVMNEGMVLSPSVIHEKRQKYEDLALAAKKGSNDPENEDGGWMPAQVRRLTPDDKGHVRLLEYEGDLVIPRKTVESMVIRGVIVTVACGKTGEEGPSVKTIRLRFRKDPFPTYIVFPYHVEDLDCPYASSPLMKGRTLQASATFALNRLLDSAMLNVAPPVGYDRSDMEFAAKGGPVIEPFAKWGTAEDVNVHEIGSPQAMLQAYALILQQYQDTTAMNPSRFGQQTNSHTTAFAKDVEIGRGTVRTVDYVRSIGKGPMTQLLYMEYEIGKRTMGNRRDTVFLDTYKGFVDLEKDDLPDMAAFEWLGAAGPQEEAALAQRRLQSATFAIQLDQTNAQLTGEKTLNIGKMIQQVLLQGGWTDLDPLLVQETGSVDSSQVVQALRGLMEQSAG